MNSYRPFYSFTLLPVSTSPDGQEKTKYTYGEYTYRRICIKITTMKPFCTLSSVCHHYVSLHFKDLKNNTFHPTVLRWLLPSSFLLPSSHTPNTSFHMWDVREREFAKEASWWNQERLLAIFGLARSCLYCLAMISHKDRSFMRWGTRNRPCLIS